MVDHSNGNGHGKKPNGRPRALDDAKKNQILAFVSAGGSRTKAAAYVGVSVTTVADEMGRDPKFSDSLTRAEGDNYLTHIQRVCVAGTEDWRASAWFLERKYPEEFGKKVEVTQIDQTEVKQGTDIFTSIRSRLQVSN